MNERTWIYKGEPNDFNWAGFGSVRTLAEYQKGSVPPPVLWVSDGYDEGVLSGGKKNNFDMLKGYEDRHGRGLDLIVFENFLPHLPGSLGAEFKDKLVVLYNSDLGLLDESGNRILIQDDPVYAAIQSGMPSTRSSVALVGEDGQPQELIVQGDSVGVWGELYKLSPSGFDEVLQSYVSAHKGLQRVRSGLPALRTAIKLISQGAVSLSKEKVFYNKWRQVFIGGRPMDYGGFQLMDK